MVIKIITLCYIYIEMVKSIINPTNINYSEDTTIDDIDDDFQTTIYDYSVYNLDIEIISPIILSISFKADCIFFSLSPILLPKDKYVNCIFIRPN